MRLSEVTSVISDYTLGTVIATLLCALERRLAREQESQGHRDQHGAAPPTGAQHRADRIAG